MSDVVIIEDENVLREVLVEGLEGVLPALSFDKYGSVEEALEGIDSDPPRLVISDVRLPGKSGVDFLIDAQKRWPETRFILMTAFATLVSREQAYEYGALRLLRKPFALEEMALAVEEALREETFSGKFRGISLIDLMQVINLGQKTLAIFVRRGDSQASIYFEEGEITHAEAGVLGGVAAFNEMVRWHGGALDVRYGLEPPEVSIKQSFQHLILEAMRLIDHERRDADEPGRNGQSCYQKGPSNADSTDLIAEVEDAVPSTIVQPPEEDSQAYLVHQVSEVLARVSTEPQRAAGSPSIRGKILSRIDLAPLAKVEGFLAAALVDSDSGMSLASQIVGEFDICAAAAAMAQIIRIENKMAEDLSLADAIEDILISRGGQNHILRPLEGNGTLFLYAVFERESSNLALVRHALRAFENQLYQQS